MPIKRIIPALCFLAASTAGAQAYNYPALQTPRIVDREYNFLAASGNKSGTSLLFQWREGMTDGFQLILEAGFAAPTGHADTRPLLGAGLAWQAARASDDFPFDVALTGEAGLSSGNNNTVVRLPFGASVGHTFTLDNGNQLTPFVHPRLSIDHCSSCGTGGSGDSKVNVDFDLGINYEVTPQVGLRVAAMLGGSSYVGGSNAVGFSVAWTPKGLRK
jgi:hypothetical protein